MEHMKGEKGDLGDPGMKQQADYHPVLLKHFCLYIHAFMAYTYLSAPMWFFLPFSYQVDLDSQERRATEDNLETLECQAKMERLVYLGIEVTYLNSALKCVKYVITIILSCSTSLVCLR